MTTPSETAIKLACERAKVPYRTYLDSELNWYTFQSILAHARDIERWEPHLCVDPVRAEAERIYAEWSSCEMGVSVAIELAIRRGMEIKS